MYRNLRDFMRMRGISAEQVAAKLGFSKSTFVAKVEERIPFTLDEAKAVRDGFFPGFRLEGPFGLFESDGDVPCKSDRAVARAEAVASAMLDNHDDPETREIAEELCDAARLADPDHVLKVFG